VGKYLQIAIQKYASSAPRLSAWLEENLSERFTVFDHPLEHQRIIRTTNSLERIRDARWLLAYLQNLRGAVLFYNIHRGVKIE
jgi:transposase-like protein